uniref:DUF4806 domain-containing protein n=1 Tax=Trichogramma kaykai TaxID=54128 RepID=A0ABD2W903_9HYME
MESSQKDLKEKIEELISNQETTNESLHKSIKNREKELLPTIPEFLPFRTREEMESVVDFNDLVRYLKYKADSFINNCAKRFLEVAFDKNDQLIDIITWVGSKVKPGLKNSKFMEACIIAIRSNVFPEPNEKQIDFAFQKALKAMKERVRKSNINLNKKKIDDNDKENKCNNANSMMMRCCTMSRCRR